MNEHGTYRETLAGRTVLRMQPGHRHELICSRLHQVLAPVVAQIRSSTLLAVRTAVELGPDTVICPDLAIIATDTGRLWLAVEIIDSHDHRVDTVVKKELYELYRVPRLWIIDPRYDNVEVYQSTEYGLMLQHMLAGKAMLVEPLLPGFELRVDQLFVT